jgi:hypothetical protein
MYNAINAIHLSHLPSSSVGTSFEAIDLIAMKDVPFKISTNGAVRKIVLGQ